MIASLMAYVASLMNSGSLSVLRSPAAGPVRPDRTPIHLQHLAFVPVANDRAALAGEFEILHKQAAWI